MPGLLDKFNTLVKASLNTLIDEAGNRIPGIRLPEAMLGKDIDSEIKVLRKQIDDAIADEDKMQARLNQMQQQILLLDQQTDQALERGDENSARQLAQQLQAEERQMNFLRSDLEQHRVVTSQFISQVSALEAIVADSRHQQGEAPAEAQPSSSANITAPTEVLSNLLRGVRETVEKAADTAAETIENIRAGEQPTKIKVEIQSDSNRTAAAPANQPAAQAQPLPATPPASTASVDQKAVDEDLAKRRSRLSKPE